MGWCGSPWAEFGHRWNKLDPGHAANEQGAHVASAKLPMLGSGVLWAGVQGPALGPWRWQGQMGTGAGCQRRAGVCWGDPGSPVEVVLGELALGLQGKDTCQSGCPRALGSRSCRSWSGAGAAGSTVPTGRWEWGQGQPAEWQGWCPVPGVPGAGGHSRVMVPHAARLPVTGQWLVPSASAAPGAVPVPCACCPGSARF